jgi:hypothetical protein
MQHAFSLILLSVASTEQSPNAEFFFSVGLKEEDSFEIVKPAEFATGNLHLDLLFILIQVQVIQVGISRVGSAGS